MAVPVFCSWCKEPTSPVNLDAMHREVWMARWGTAKFRKVAHRFGHMPVCDICLDSLKRLVNK